MRKIIFHNQSSSKYRPDPSRGSCGVFIAQWKIPLIWSDRVAQFGRSSHARSACEGNLHARELCSRAIFDAPRRSRASRCLSLAGGEAIQMNCIHLNAKLSGEATELLRSSSFELEDRHWASLSIKMNFIHFNAKLASQASLIAKLLRNFA